MSPPVTAPPHRRGRPALPGTYKTTVRLGAAVKAAAVAEARRRGATLGDVLEEAVRRMLGMGDEGERAA